MKNHDKRWRNMRWTDLGKEEGRKEGGFLNSAPILTLTVKTDSTKFGLTYQTRYEGGRIRRGDRKKLQSVLFSPNLLTNLPLKDRTLRTSPSDD